MHELYLDQVVIFLIKYNEVPAELYLIQNKMTWSKYNECTYYLFQILQVLLNLLYFISKHNAGDRNISSVLRPLYFGFCKTSRKWLTVSIFRKWQTAVWHYGLTGGHDWHRWGWGSWLTWMTCMDDWHGWLALMTGMDDWHGWLAWMTGMDDWHRWLAWMTGIDDWHGWLPGSHGLS